MKIEYDNIYMHYVFTTLHRQALISEIHRERIEKYITGIFKNNDCPLYAIYANPEHVHLLVSRSPGISDETILTIVADSVEKFINDNQLCSVKFKWQNKASAFSVSKGDVDKVCKYILNQPVHHRKITWEEEYQAFLKFYQKTLNPENKVSKSRDCNH